MSNKVIALSTENESVKDKNRFGWVDWSKSIGIFLVIFIHCLLVIPVNETLKFVVSFGIIPIFFFLSGYFHKPDKPKPYIIKNVRSLLRPYPVYYLINYPFWVLTFLFITNQGKSVEEVATFENLVIKPIRGFFIGNGADIEGFSCMVSSPLWFLISLLTCKLLALVLIRPNNVVFTIINTVLVGVLGYLLHISCENQYLSFITTLHCYPFLVFGYLTKQYIDFSTIKRKFYLPIALLALLGTYIVRVINNHGLNINIREFGDYVIMVYIGGGLGIIAIVFTSLYLSNIKLKLINILSASTLIIMGLQGILLRMFFPILYFIDDYVYNIENHTLSHALYQLFVCLLITVITLLVLLPVMVLILKKAPWLAGKA